MLKLKEDIYSKYSGITLIALVLTMIILLIIAGTTIVSLRNTPLEDVSNVVEIYNNSVFIESEEVSNIIDKFDNMFETDIDNEKPKIAEIELIEKDKTSFTLKATGVDADSTPESIQTGIKKYEFYLYDAEGKELEKEIVETLLESQIWEVNEKNAGTTYKAKVIVYDKARKL